MKRKKKPSQLWLERNGWLWQADFILFHQTCTKERPSHCHFLVGLPADMLKRVSRARRSFRPPTIFRLTMTAASLDQVKIMRGSCRTWCEDCISLKHSFYLCEESLLQGKCLSSQITKMKRRILLKPNVDGAKPCAGRAEGGFKGMIFIMHELNVRQEQWNSIGIISGCVWVILITDHLCGWCSNPQQNNIILHLWSCRRT